MAQAKTHALYLEMVKDVRGSQVLVIPPIYNPLTGTTSRARIMTRKISEAHPRRSWNTVDVRKEIDANPSLSSPSTVSIIDAVSPAVDAVGNFIVGMVSGRWKMTKAPVVVEMSFDDMRDIEEGKTPNALLRRVTKVRTEAGYPDTVWPMPIVEEPTLSTPAPEVLLERFTTGTPEYSYKSIPTSHSHTIEFKNP